MYLLALDTATEVCGVAVVSDHAPVAQLTLTHGNTHARTIIPAVEWILTQLELAMDRIDLFVVNQGPGSFTGLRIGIATAKGLASAVNKPLIGVSGLAALARPVAMGSRLICPMISARRGEVYWALYESRDGELAVKIPPRVGPAREAAALIQAPCTYVGNGAREFANDLDSFGRTALRSLPEYLNTVSPAVLGQLGFEKWSAGDLEPGYDLSPVYIRKSDAARPATVQGPTDGR